LSEAGEPSGALAELRRLVDQLDTLVPKEEARLRIPSDPDGHETTGTRRGYLRLGIEFLRAGLAPTTANGGGAAHLPLEIDYLLTPDSATPFEVCEVDADVEGLPPRARKLGAVGQLLAALAAVSIVGLILVGAAAVLARMFR
jgi:hypothetical protein